MDPDANLKEQLAIAREIHKVWDDCNADGTLTPRQNEHLAEQADRLADLIVALAEHLKRGGSPPRAWQKGGRTR